MHVPDGFLDAPTSLGTAVVAAGVGRGLPGALGPSRARRPLCSARGAGRRVHLRRADGHLPDRGGHVRPPGRRGARRRARRTGHGDPVPDRRAGRAGVPLRRRRSERPGHQRAAHGRHRRLGRLRRLPPGARGAAPPPVERQRGGRRRRVRERARGGPGVRRPLRAGRCRPHPARLPRRLHDRLARASSASARPPSPCSRCRASSPPVPTSCTAPADGCPCSSCAPRSRSREHPPPRRARAGRQRR